jgi:peptidoglycan hydrolase-like protein with peptidoglycan-binding domain
MILAIPGPVKAYRSHYGPVATGRWAAGPVAEDGRTAEGVGGRLSVLLCPHTRSAELITALPSTLGKIKSTRYVI